MGPALKSAFCAPVGSENNDGAAVPVHTVYFQIQRRSDIACFMARLFHLLFRRHRVYSGVFAPVYFRAARTRNVVQAFSPRVNRHRAPRICIRRHCGFPDHPYCVSNPFHGGRRILSAIPSLSYKPTPRQAPGGRSFSRFTISLKIGAELKMSQKQSDKVFIKGDV